MIEQIDIHQFKAFQQLKIETLRQVNVIVGANNVGKTALLEAVDMALPGKPDRCSHGFFRDVSASPPASAGHQDWKNYTLPIGQARVGSIGLQVAGKWLGVGFGEVNPRWCHADMERVQREALFNKVFRTTYRDIRLPEENAFAHTLVQAWPCSPIELTSIFETAILRSDMETRIEQSLAELDARIKTLRSQQPPGRERQIYVDIGAPQKIPLVQLGQGAQKLVMLASKAALAEGGVLLVDEIDVGFHHGYLERLWQAVFAMARDLKVQVFATTHSYECIKAAAKVASQIEGDQLALHRLERHGADIRCITGTEDTLVAAMEAGFEVR